MIIRSGIMAETIRIEAKADAIPMSSERMPWNISTVIVDPPRTGMSREALDGLIQCAPGRVVYVSCDTATLARDARRLVDGGYALEGLTGIDLFPNTAHVESVAVFARSPLPTT